MADDLCKLGLEPLKDGYNWQPGNNFDRVRLDGGRPRVRRKRYNSWGKVSVKWAVDCTDYEYLTAFLDSLAWKPFRIDLITQSCEYKEHIAIVDPETVELEEVGGCLNIVSAELDVKPVRSNCKSLLIAELPCYYDECEDAKDAFDCLEGLVDGLPEVLD